jgi:rsbT antagonist protein RsbS
MIVPILKIGKNLIASIQVPLTDQQICRFQKEVLEEIERSETSGIVIDITAMDVVDSYMARILSEIAVNAELMGTRAVIGGLTGLETALNLEHGLKKLESFTSSRRISDEK